LIYSKTNGVVTGGFRVGTPETITKAALPAMVYDDYPSIYDNLGDPRITHYLRAAPLGENAYPENSSPNRRNIRLDIYQADASTKPKVYARMQPSEWPDGGHNAAVGNWSPGTDDKTEMTDSRFDLAYDPVMRFGAPQFISNAGRFYSVTEVGRVFDPAMHAPVFASAIQTSLLRNQGKLSGGRWPDINERSGGPYYGGGNTLRIGRPEHPAFVRAGQPGMEAALLLELFHVGLSRSADEAERRGPLVRIAGHININTATFDSLRAVAAGALVTDPLLARKLGDCHVGAPVMSAATEPLMLEAPKQSLEADRIAEAIIRGRPYGGTSGLAAVCDANGAAVFGNRSVYPQDTTIEWSDAAAEELFARVFEASTVRSRNFRVWLVAQALAPATNRETPPAVLAEARSVYCLFADPGPRAADGAIAPEHIRIQVISRNEF
jgi:hypothetical protein